MSNLKIAIELIERQKELIKNLEGQIEQLRTQVQAEHALRQQYMLQAYRANEALEGKEKYDG